VYMDRREFIAYVGGTAALATMTMSEKANALEQAMSEKLEKIVVKSHISTTFGREPQKYTRSPVGRPALKKNQVFHMGHDPRLPLMSDKPTLLEFFEKRIGFHSHLLQSARLAKINGLPEKTVLACLLHDISVNGYISADHGYYGAQLIAPYVDEEISWAIKYHQALRFVPDEEMGYSYPQAYIELFGEDYVPDPYIFKDAEYARNHKWYMTARQITINDVYSFDPNVKVSIDDFADLIGRHFRDPEEGLGYDGSPSAHMWRTMIFPNNFL
jgi:hypothetical protein